MMFGLRPAGDRAPGCASSAAGPAARACATSVKDAPTAPALANTSRSRRLIPEPLISTSDAVLISQSRSSQAGWNRLRCGGRDRRVDQRWYSHFDRPAIGLSRRERNDPIAARQGVLLADPRLGRKVAVTGIAPEIEQHRRAAGLSLLGVRDDDREA